MCKKSINFVAVILATVVVIGLSSCKDKEVYYSCDPTIDAVIKQNLPYYEGMTREEWKNLPDSLKRAAFAAMNPELKKEFWWGKLNEIKEAKFFNNAEKEHIALLYNYLLSIDDFFTDKYTENLELQQNVLEYYKEWAFYGCDFLDWEVIDVILIAEDPEELDEDYIEHVKMNTKPATELTQAGSTCNCLYNVYCERKYGTLCEESECDKKLYNCGIFLSSECKRKCYEPKPGSGNNSGSQIGEEKLKFFQNMTKRELFEEMFKELSE